MRKFSLTYPEKEVKIHSQKADKDITQLNFYFSLKEGEKAAPILPEYPEFTAEFKEILVTPKNWYIGLGSPDKLDKTALAEVFREVAEKVVTKLEKLAILLPEEIFSLFTHEDIFAWLSLAFNLAIFPTDLLKEKPKVNQVKLKEIFLLNEIFKKFAGKKNKWSRLAVHTNAMRQTQALPGNYITSESLAQRSQEIAKKYQLKIRVFGKKDLEKMGAHGILAVNQGSAKEPKLVVMEYNPPKAKGTIAFAGKGVTFDTGGISLKPSQDMHEMKMDMSGAAAVIHAMAAIAEGKLPVRVIGAVGLVENMPSGTAFKPGDVYKSLKGITIEVQNTDAEGRLVLGDVLYYLEKNYKPELLVDLATLTGACVVALGHFYAGLFTLHDEVREFLLKVSRRSYEPLWPLPVERLYRDQLKSDIADYNNIAGRPGGASTAAAFLSLFVEKSTRWAHIDIAGPAILNKPFGLYPSPASGFGVRLLYETAELFCEGGLS